MNVRLTLCFALQSYKKTNIHVSKSVYENSDFQWDSKIQ